MMKKTDVIVNNFNLLGRMMKDMRSACSLYRPTNYWQYYELSSMKYLENNGLGNFRSYNTGTLASFGAGTYRNELLTQRYRNLIDFKGFGKASIIAALFKIYGKLFDCLGGRFDWLNMKKWFDNEKYYLQELQERQNSQYRYSKLMDRLSGLNVLDSIEDSSIGNPYDLFEINEKKYTLEFLRYFDQMAYVNTHLELKRVNSILEIGSGYGGSVEVYLKAFPHITYFNFDIAPQLYVAQQYLSAVFPGQVYGYENFLSDEKVTLGKYRAFCLPTWSLNLISGINFDLFINSGSFQEMEPEIVKNYYFLIKERVNYAYLFQLIHGTNKKISGKRSGGCVQILRIDDYLSIFKDFQILNRTDHYRVRNPYAHLILKGK